MVRRSLSTCRTCSQERLHQIDHAPEGLLDGAAEPEHLPWLISVVAYEVGPGLREGLEHIATVRRLGRLLQHRRRDGGEMLDLAGCRRARARPRAAT
jgi:hypothetical protein